MAYIKLKNRPGVFEVGPEGNVTPLTAETFAARGNPYDQVHEIDHESSTPAVTVATAAPADLRQPTGSPATSFAGLDTSPSTMTRGGLTEDPTEGTPPPPRNGATGNDGRGGGGGGGTPGDGSGGSTPGSGGAPDDHDDLREDPVDEHTGQGSTTGHTGGTTTINIGEPKDTKPSIKLSPTIGNAAPVKERTAQGLNLHRDAPVAFTPSGTVINPGQPTQAGAYQAPGARQGPVGFQHAAITIPPPPAPPQVPGVAQPGAYEGAPAYQTAAGGFQGEDMGGLLDSFARDAMANPNRYSSDWMKSAIAAINGQIDNSRAQGLRSIGEQMASRGLVGSGMEMTQDASLEGQLDQNRLENLANLLQQMATVDAQDRATAGQLGLQAGEFGRELGQDRLAEGHYADQSAQARAAAAEAAKLGRANFGLDTAKFTNDAQYRNAVLGEQAAMDRANLQLNQQDIDLRAHQIQQEAIQKGQQMDLDQARDQASAELQRAQLSEQGREFNVSSSIDQEQFNQDIALRAHQIQQEAIQRGQQMDLDEAMDQARRQVALDQLAVDERGAISDERLRELALLLQAMQAVND